MKLSSARRMSFLLPVLEIQRTEAAHRLEVTVPDSETRARAMNWAGARHSFRELPLPAPFRRYASSRSLTEPNLRRKGAKPWQTTDGASSLEGLSSEDRPDPRFFPVECGKTDTEDPTDAIQVVPRRTCAP